MARLDGDLAAYNLCKVVVVDVSDDYPNCALPLPSQFYPILCEVWLPRHRLADQLLQQPLVEGFLYDWHEGASVTDEPWYVGVVKISVVHA